MNKKIIVWGIIFLFLFSGMTTFPTVASNTSLSNKISETLIKNLDEKSEILEEEQGLTWIIFYCSIKGEITGYYREGKYKEWVFNCTDVRMFGIMICIWPPFGILKDSKHVKNKQMRIRNSGVAKFYGTLNEDYVNGFLFFYDPPFK